MNKPFQEDLWTFGVFLSYFKYRDFIGKRSVLKQVIAMTFC